MRYKEKPFTKKQLERIEIVSKHIKLLIDSGVEIHGRHGFLCFFHSKNIEEAEKSGGSVTYNAGESIHCESCRITDSGADDAFRYPKHLQVVKVTP